MLLFINTCSVIDDDMTTVLLSMSQCVVSQGPYCPYQCRNMCTRYTDSGARKLGSLLSAPYVYYKFLIYQMLRYG